MPFHLLLALWLDLLGAPLGELRARWLASRLVKPHDEVVAWLEGRAVPDTDDLKAIADFVGSYVPLALHEGAPVGLADKTRRLLGGPGLMKPLHASEPVDLAIHRLRVVLVDLQGSLQLVPAAYVGEALYVVAAEARKRKVLSEVVWLELMREVVAHA